MRFIEEEEIGEDRRAVEFFLAGEGSYHANSYIVEQLEVMVVGVQVFGLRAEALADHPVDDLLEEEVQQVEVRVDAGASRNHHKGSLAVVSEVQSSSLA